MRIVLTVALLALAAACSPAEEGGQMSAGCDARATASWAAGETPLSVEADTVGPDCQRAVATLVVRDGSGVPLYAEAHLARNLMTLAPARDPAAMQTALDQWVTPGSTMISTSALPDWTANARGPESGEFPFYPEPDFDRESYLTLRRNDLPLFCYVQGMESMACLVFSGEGEVSKIGVQTFPG
jgi:hypothetical protein